MTTISSYPVRDVNADSFLDITVVAVAGITKTEGVVEVVFDGDLTTREQYEVRRRLRTVPAEETREKQAVNAYTSITDFNKIAAPTNVQFRDHLRLLGLVTQRLIRSEFPDAAKDLLGE